MQVRVVYLGILREIAGREREVVQLGENSRLADLFADLQHRIPKLSDFRGAIALAVNYEYSGGETVLRDDDEVALIPPVSGGKLDDELSTAEMPAPLISEHARITSGPIKTVAILAAIKKPEDGAVAIFDGIVRNNSRGRRTLYLEYSAYDRMALAKMEELARQALIALCHSRCAPHPSRGTVTDRRKQRLYCGCVGASGRGLRRLPLAHRHAENHGAHLEEGVLRRRRNLGRRRAFSGGDSAGRTTITSGFGRQQRAAFNPTRQIVRNGVYTNECPLTPRSCAPSAFSP